MTSKLIAVVGATGNQGSSVANTFLSLPNWKVRCLTRNPDSDKAKKLAEAGAEVVKADLADFDAVAKAFEGAHAIFANTDFWGPYRSLLAAGTAPESASKQAFDTEVLHATNIALAAAASPTLERYVYSALGPMKEASGGKYPHSYHWETKAAAVKYIEREQPALAAKTSFIYIGGYITNPFLLPKYSEQMGTYVMMLPGPETTRFPIIDTVRSTGSFVRALIEDEAPGTKLLAYDCEMTMGEVLEAWRQASGKDAVFMQVDLQKLQELSGLPMEVLDGPAFLAEYHYTAGVENVIEPSQLKMKTETRNYLEFLKSQSTEYLLGSKATLE